MRSNGFGSGKEIIPSCNFICGPALTYRMQKGSGKLGQKAWVCDEEFTSEISILVQSHDKLLFVGIWRIVAIWNSYANSMNRT